MDLAAAIYAFVLSLGASQFVINDYLVVAPHVVEVDVETLNTSDDQRYILLIENGRIIQHARVPLLTAECQAPH